MAGYLISVWQMRGQRPTRAARHMHLRRGLTLILRGRKVACCTEELIAEVENLSADRW